MFTGLIEDLGTVRGLQLSGNGGQLTVATALPTAELTLGESVAVNGACLTVVSIDVGSFAADVSPETLTCTTLGALKPGGRVNLERAMRLGDRLGGHLVSGHIDACAAVTAIQRDANAIRFSVRFPSEIARYLVPKGSVTIDGISLTINSVENDTFSVAIIPHTLAMTTLQFRQPGYKVNIETDLIGRYVERLLSPAKEGDDTSGVNLELLAKHGFL